MPDVIPTRPSAPARTPLTEVAEWLGELLVESRGNVSGTTVTGLSLSTHRVYAGDLYAALPGANVHGAKFAAEAVSAGAVAILAHGRTCGRLGGRR